MLILIFIDFLIFFTLFYMIKNEIHKIKNKKFGGCTFVISVSGHKENIELILRNAVNEIKRKENLKGIVCIDCGMDNETRKICKLFSNDYEFISLVDKTDINFAP